MNDRIMTVVRASVCVLSFSMIIAVYSSRGQTVPKGGAAMRLTIAALGKDGSIPARYTCQGNDISPALSWIGAPADTKSFALIVDDPDAPDPAAPKMTWVHWVLYSIPPQVASLEEGVAEKALPAGTMSGLNDWKRTGYGGPCPPIGRHRYFFKLYALDIILPNLQHPTKSAVEKAMHGHILAKAEVVGTYKKH